MYNDKAAIMDENQITWKKLIKMSCIKIFMFSTILFYLPNKRRNIFLYLIFKLFNISTNTLQKTTDITGATIQSNQTTLLDKDFPLIN